MKLMTLLNPENATEEEVAKYKTREAARAVVFDNDGKIALLNVSKWNYHKLPGGGIDEGESIIAALKRECREEIGCEIEVTAELGEILEYRKMFNVKQTSYCYLAKVVGEKGEPAFMLDEIDDGFKVEWVSIEKAKSLFDSEKPLEKQGELYIVPREKIILALAE
jgi:8-oxo-dGTP pyrophosphatase MutT (NUDIX family)